MLESRAMAHPNLAKFLKFLVFYTVLVILWGAWVRISHSGDGCGESWPLCHGEFLPTSHGGKTWVEMTHRLMSGAFGLLVLGIFLWIRRTVPPGQPLRRWALMSLIFTVTEALLGAKLVLFGLVGQNASAFRSVAMGLHFLNSAFLVASLTQCMLFAQPGERARRPLGDWIRIPVFRRLPVLTVTLLSFLGVTGTVAALSTTLFPSTSLIEGFARDFAEDAHFLLKLRALHPTTGIFGGVALAILFLLFAEVLPVEHRRERRASYGMAIFIGLTVIVGTITLLWLSPVALKLTHLLLAHSLVVMLTIWWHALHWPAKEPSVSVPSGESGK